MSREDTIPAEKWLENEAARFEPPADGTCITANCWNDASDRWGDYCDEHGFDRYADRGNVW